MNIEHRASNSPQASKHLSASGGSNVEWEKMKKQTYDLEERLLEYSVRIIKIVEQLPNTRAGNHVAGQLLRSGTSPYPNHGEAQAAESPKDFIHKLRISLKELRETQRWLKLIQRVPLIKKPGSSPI
jgi:four helix bundle protein